jgi:hypothetical protein
MSLAVDGWCQGHQAEREVEIIHVFIMISLYIINIPDGRAKMEVF